MAGSRSYSVIGALYIVIGTGTEGNRLSHNISDDSSPIGYSAPYCSQILTRLTRIDRNRYEKQENMLFFVFSSCDMRAEALLREVGVPDLLVLGQ